MFFPSFPTAFCLPNWGPISGSSDSDVRCRSHGKGRTVPTLLRDTRAALGSSLKEPGMPPTPAIAWPEIKKDTSFLHIYIKQATWGAAGAAVTLHNTTFSTSCPHHAPGTACSPHPWRLVWCKESSPWIYFFWRAASHWFCTFPCSLIT